MAIPDAPLTRAEQYLDRIATDSGTIPDEPLTRVEQYLDYIAKNGSGGGGGGGVTPEKFGAKGDGLTDDTVAIQMAVDSGKNVVFGYQKTYKCGTINVIKNIEIDCRWAQFICTEEKLFYCHGAVAESISGADYAANKLYTLPSGDKYTGMAMLKSPDVVNPTRSYYYGGFVTLFADGITLETCPVGFTSVTIDKINPITCSIKNLGFVSHPNNPDLNYSVWCEYGLNCEFDHIRHHGEKYEIVRIFKSYGCVVKNVDANVDYNGSVANYYPIGISDSTKTRVEDSTVYSAWWHSVSTGGNYCVLDTLIKNCELHTTEGAESYNDHGNTYRTRIENSVVDSCNVGAGGVVVDTTITANHGFNSSSYSCYVRFAVTPISGINKFRAENIKFETGGFALGNDGIQIYATAQEGTHTFYLDEVTINHVRTSAVKTNVVFSVSGSSVNALEVNGGITIRDFQGGFIPNSASDAKTTFGNKSYLSVEDCLVRDSSSPSRGVAQIGSSGLKMPPYVYVVNSLLYRIAGVIANLTMTDVRVTNNAVDNLQATYLNAVNCNGNIKISDILNCSYAELVRCNFGQYWILANVNKSTNPQRAKYATWSNDGLAWNDITA